MISTVVAENAGEDQNISFLLIPDPYRLFLLLTHVLVDTNHVLGYAFLCKLVGANHLHDLHVEVSIMSDEMIVETCSPTLAGLKTGSMFSTKYTDRRELFRQLKRLNLLLVPKGLRIIPLRFTEDRALIYLYRPSCLSRDLTDKEARKILESRGYIPENESQCIHCLVGRLKQEGDFPHEIGLFLGYPAEDVAGFIEKGARACLCTGVWKVYSHRERALELFSRYKKCSASYKVQFRRGTGIDALAVAL